MGNRSSMIINELHDMDIETGIGTSDVSEIYERLGGLVSIDGGDECGIECGSNDGRSRDISVTKEEVYVSITPDAISIINRFAEVIKGECLFKEVIEYSDPLEVSGLYGIFEQRFAMYIVSSIMKGKSYIRSYMAYPSDIIRGINKLFSEVLNIGYSTFVEENLLDGYPITLLSEISGVSRFHVNIIGEAVRRFVEIRKSQPKWLPREIHNLLMGTVPLVGDRRSPLTKRELEAIYRYLGVRRTIYVHILLNTLFELKQHEKILNGLMREDELYDVCRSGWLYLLQFASVQNVCDDLSQMNNVESDF